MTLRTGDIPVNNIGPKKRSALRIFSEGIDV